MTYKDTLFFIGKCLTITHEEANKADIEKLLQTNTVNWDAVVQVSTAHYVFPALYLNLQRAGFLHYLPEDLVSYMAHITEVNRERNTQIIAQAKEINTLLRNNDITPIFLKGTGNLVEGLYPDIAERMVGDIDFIVEQPLFLKAAAILEYHGYISKNNINIGMHWHYPGLVHPDKIASVEVHQKILKDDYQQTIGISLFSEVKHLEGELTVLSIQNKLLATTLPKIINDNLYHKKAITLRNAYDVYLLSIQEPIYLAKIPSQNIKKKLINYISCMKMIFANTPMITVVENQHTTAYQKSFLSLLEQNVFERKKVKLINFYITQKNRLIILKRTFTHPAYRNFVRKRMAQKSFWKKYLLGKSEGLGV